MSDKNTTIKIRDVSIPCRKYLVLAGIAFIFLIVYARRLFWVYETYHHIPIQGVCLLLLALFFLLHFVTAKCTYELHDDELVLVKRSWFRHKRLHIPYDKIYGVHHFKNQLMKPTTYRYTYHMYNQLDNREIWSLLYDIGEIEKIGRVMMTGSVDFWHELSLILPDKIGIPQEEVIAYVYQDQRRKLIESGKVPPEVLEKLKSVEEEDKEYDMTFEEGIEQLRQEGTDMGGKDYEVTLDDIKEKEKEKKKEKEK